MAIQKFKGSSSNTISTFDMWLMEFDRLNDILKATSMLFLTVRNQPETIINIYDCLVEFYRVLRPLLTNNERVNMDGLKNELRGTVFDEYNRQTLLVSMGASQSVDEEVLEKCSEFYNYLLDLRQLKGMGIKTFKDMSDSEKMKNVVGGGEA
jgi:hypothetical protein